MNKKRLNILIVAGEASGDIHAAKLVDALMASRPDAEFSFFGAAGPRMRASGVEAIVEADHLSIVGLLEIGRALPMFYAAFRKLRNVALRRRPDAVVLVDFPDFNLKLAKTLKKKGLKVVYYISPQLWAWRKYRIRTVRKYVDLLISILPFEKDWYAEHGIGHVEYVGSPLASEVHASLSRDDFCTKHGVDPMKPIVSLLPGSRQAEIARILPELLKTASVMSAHDSSIQFIVALPPGRLEKIDERSKRSDRNIYWIEGETFDALNSSDAAAITSGTATLEAGIIGVPMAIVYKTSSVNYKLLRPLIDVEHFGLINLIAGKRVANELIQDEFTPETLSAEIFRLLEPGDNERVRQELSKAADKLGHGGASIRAAEAVLKIL